MLIIEMKGKLTDWISIGCIPLAAVTIILGTLGSYDLKRRLEDNAERFNKRTNDINRRLEEYPNDLSRRLGYSTERLSKKINDIKGGLYKPQASLSYSEDKSILRAINLMNRKYTSFDEWWEDASEFEKEKYHETRDGIRNESRERWKRFMASEGDMGENFQLIYKPMPRALQEYIKQTVIDLN